jgi:hypothetical protein
MGKGRRAERLTGSKFDQHSQIITGPGMHSSGALTGTVVSVPRPRVVARLFDGGP